jgi:uncharacterized SAM-dependent methyltransferase
MALQLGKKSLLLELGSGSSQKIRLLLDAQQPAAYMPMDISKEHLWHSAQTLATDYPDLDIHVNTPWKNFITLPQKPIFNQNKCG